MNKKELKYFKLMEELKEQIVSGELKAGDKLPSENELSTEYAVSRQTVRKALAILENEGYVYAEHGRGTFCSQLVRHSGNSKNIAVITTYISDYIFPRVIKGIDTVFTREGYSILLKNTRNSRGMEAKCLEEILQKDIDGIIIEPSKSQIYCRHMNLYKKLDEYKIPYVFIQGCFEQMSEKPHVLMDDFGGGYMITKYLLDNGHRNIVGVFKADDVQGQNRHKGYVKALAQAGIAYDPDKVVWFYTEDRVIHPYESIRRRVAENEGMDAIVCYNDQIAMKVIQAVRDAGKRVPEDISVTGYDNSYVIGEDGLKLTTIVHPQEKLGEMAAEMLLELIRNKGESDKSPQILIRPEIVIGNSCKKNNLL